MPGEDVLQSFLHEHRDRFAEPSDDPELPKDVPTLRDVLPYFAECDADEQFEFGLDLLIRGLEGKVSTSSEPSTAG